MDREDLINKLIELLKPIVINLEYDFYYLEFVEEEGGNYLRVYIDNEKGISLEDCEKVSRKISGVLDEEDPIEEGYYLEVSSPGVFRRLFTDEHLSKYLQSKISIRLTQLFMGQRKFLGILEGFNENQIKIKLEDEEIDIPRNIIEIITLEATL